MNENTFAPTPSNGYVSDEDLRVLSEDSGEIGAAGATPAAVAAGAAVVAAGGAVSSAMQDGCPTTACTTRC